MKKVSKFLKVRRKRSKPFDQKNYNESNIIIIIGIVALIIAIIVSIILMTK
ncbi:hypothetical protein [uncultured Tenacibaculum sp.]|uniref:hypothetical protein n=1 Tax=uncultured Tenacibaculum sp. TaxID=174713 RepID=UPI00260DE5FC|nr:hypothetical protein [uncultured Tenacibaculum sp.]